MKYLLILLLFPSVSFSQKHKGYGQIAYSGFFNKGFGHRHGFNASGGAYAGNRGSIGAGVDFWLLQKKYDKMAHAYLDFRFYLVDLKKEFTPFISFQPGMVLFNQTTQAGTTRGSFGVNGMAGFFLRPEKGPGFSVSAGVSHLTFHRKNASENLGYTGAKVVAGIVF